MVVHAMASPIRMCHSAELVEDREGPPCHGRLCPERLLTNIESAHLPSAEVTHELLQAREVFKFKRFRNPFPNGKVAGPLMAILDPFRFRFLRLWALSTSPNPIA